MEVAARSVGIRYSRIDAYDKVTGRAVYSKDISLQGMLHGRLLTSPHPHAIIKRIDASKALEVEGIKAIMTHEDTPKIIYNPAGHPSAKPASPLDKYVLADRARFVGDIIAAVAAETLDAAKEAVSLIDVEYESLPALFEAEQAMKPEAILIHPNVSNRNLASATGQPTNREWGDFGKSLSEADYVMEASYSTPRQCHLCLETNSCVAQYDMGSGRLTLWASTQIPFVTRHLLSYVIGIPAGKIRVLTPHVGGGFGSRQELCEIFPIASLLSMKTGRPVKITLTREEEFVSTRTRHPIALDVKAGLRKDGTITALGLRAVGDTGAYASHGEVVILFGGLIALSAYRASGKRLDTYCVYTNKPVAAAFRGYGNLQAHFALESHIDMLAEKLEMDPLEFRRRNYIREGELILIANQKVTSCQIEECLRLGAERIGWTRKKKPGQRIEGNKAHGIGMSAAMHLSGAKFFIPEFSEAQVRLNQDGSVFLYTGAMEGGQGCLTALAQIAAEELGIQPSQVHVASPPIDTDLHPMDLGSYASRTIYVAGGAVKAAAREVKRQALDAASKRLDASVKRLRMEGGQVFVEGDPERTIALDQLALETLFSKEDANYFVGRAFYEPPGLAPSFAAHFAEVEVDIETGLVKVLNYVAAHDVGQAINPSNVEGQIQGGVAQGIGFTFLEDLVLDQHGSPMNPDLLNYKFPTAMEMPNVEAIIVESHEPTGPFGAKSVGEIGLVAVPAALANAVYNALGVRFMHLPITPDKILQALKEKKLGA